MRFIIEETNELAGKWAAHYIADKINNHKEDRPFVLGLPTGSSPIGVYKNLIVLMHPSVFGSFIHNLFFFQ